jgi:hypothetical protein
MVDLAGRRRISLSRARVVRGEDPARVAEAHAREHNAAPAYEDNSEETYTHVVRPEDRYGHSY